ncbi:MAG TPA: hypothetical protein VFY65_04200 [Longimicrobium sp.]|nr:hypothetical protein [Longimicrobium sp.]
MKNRTSAAPIFASPRAASPSWGERLMLRVLGLPTEEEAERILRSRPGFIASLTPEQRAFIDAWNGPDPDVMGSPNGPRRTF